MSNNNSASKETIANLIKSSGLSIDDLYKSLKGELVVRSLMNEHTPELYVLTQDMQNGIKFILIDIGTSLKAECSVNNVYEKRFYLKNIMASISEGYKLIFNFGPVLRKKSLWSKLLKKVCEDCNMELVTEGKDIERRLIEFGENEIDKDLRDLTLHYDDKMIKVYQKTILINSEEDVIKKVNDFMGILKDIMIFSNNVDVYCHSQSGKEKPSSLNPIELNVNQSHSLVCNLINKNGQIENIFNNLPKSATESLDMMATHFEKTEKLKEFIHVFTPAVGEIPEIENVQALVNVQLLIRFMMFDLVAIVDSYIKSSSDIEYALNLRRICVTKVSTMVHLYGYNSSEQDKSIWKKLDNMIPISNVELQNKNKEIGNNLNKITANTLDKDLRVRFVHLFDNSKGCTNLDEVVNSIEQINPIIPIFEIKLLLLFYKLINRFTISLMEVLTKDAHEKNRQSTKEMNDMMNANIKNIDESQLPDDIKEQLLDKMKDVKNMINNLSI